VHIHYRALLALEDIVSHVPNFLIDHEGVCKGCTLGNNVKKPFPSSQHRSKEILDLVDSHVCGVILMKSLGGTLYYVSFTHELYHKMWTYVMSEKTIFSKCSKNSKLKWRTRKGRESRSLD